MIRHLLLATLVLAVALSGCSRKSETNDPDLPADSTEQMETEVIEESTTPEPDSTTPDNSATGDDSTDQQNTGAASATGDDSANSEGQQICTTEWFEWVNAQVMSTQSEAITEQYSTGLPDVGSDEWFMAVDKLTGGDGAHGPDGGSDEWCSMMQQRLGSTD